MTSKIPPSLLYLWDKRTLYIGPLFEPLTLSQGAATLVVALDKEICFTADKQTTGIKCRSILLPAGQSVNIDTGDAIIANCNLDALGLDFAALTMHMQLKQEKISYQLGNESDFINTFLWFYQSTMSPDESYLNLDRLLVAPKGVQLPGPDQRVVQIIERIKQTIDDNLSVEDLANEVNLSVPRLVQVFKQQTGVPIRRYRLWHRLYVMAVLMGRGENLTNAALTAGFTDSSHFNHTFRSMLGMTPTMLLTQPNRLQIFSPLT